MLGIWSSVRQAFVVASILIILGYVLGYYVHDLFTLLPLLVAGGLMLAGLSGVCPMVCMLQQLPGNGLDTETCDTCQSAEAKG